MCSGCPTFRCAFHRACSPTGFVLTVRSTVGPIAAELDACHLFSGRATISKTSQRIRNTETNKTATCDRERCSVGRMDAWRHRGAC